MGLASTAQQQQYRADGWPLCPRCDEDEMASVAMLRNGGRVPGPTLDECFADDFACYKCNWRGRIKPAEAA